MIEVTRTFKEEVALSVRDSRPWSDIIVVSFQIYFDGKELKMGILGIFFYRIFNTGLILLAPHG